MVVTSALVAPTIIEADESIAMLSCRVWPKPITVVVAPVTVWPGGLPVQTVVGSGIGMQGAVAWAVTITVLVGIGPEPSVQSFWTGAQT